MQRSNQPIQHIAVLWTNVQNVIAGGERIFGLLDIAADVQDLPGAQPLPLYDVSSGAVLVDGVDVRDVTADSLRQQIGIVLQDSFLFADTLMNNIRYGRLDASNDEVIAAAKLAEAHTGRSAVDECVEVVCWCCWDVENSDYRQQKTDTTSIRCRRSALLAKSRADFYNTANQSQGTVMIRSVRAVRYVTPLREGGSLPAVIEADDEQLYVLKFRGAGQGPKVLIAELVVGELGRALGLPVPEIVFVTLDPAFGRSEPDPEIQALLKSSIGLNLALAYIPTALAFEPALAPPIALELASAIVWFDAYTTNVDRTPRNTNMLLQNDQLWLIDHGAALYMHHTWTDYLNRSTSPFAPIKDHVLLPFADQLRETDATLSSRISSELLYDIVELIPDDWLVGESSFGSTTEHRAAYRAYLERRLAAPRRFVEEAINARG